MQRVFVARHATYLGFWVPIFAMLWRRAMMMLWHAFPFLGLRFFPHFFFLLDGLHCHFYMNICSDIIRLFLWITKRTT
jgi:hypothetical protein